MTTLSGRPNNCPTVYIHTLRTSRVQMNKTLRLLLVRSSKGDVVMEVGGQKVNVCFIPHPFNAELALGNGETIGDISGDIIVCNLIIAQ